MMLPRVANGFDVHRLQAVAGGSLTLAGVRIACGMELIGHSDADVALHALTDALLAITGSGDIGSHFPDSDPQWLGADSRIFVRHALDLIKKSDCKLCFADLTLIAEKPALSPYRRQMRRALSALLALPDDAIGLKATTTESLGFTGRGEGIAALACVTVLSGRDRHSEID